MSKTESGKQVSREQIWASFESEKDKHNNFVELWGNLPSVFKGIQISVKDGSTGEVFSTTMEGDIKEEVVVKEVAKLLHAALNARMLNATGK